MPKVPLPLTDYKRIFQLTYSILNSERMELEHSCMHFNATALSILNKHYNMNARLCIGMAAYKFGSEENEVLFFADKIGNEIRASENGFHAWIETEKWLIDFLSPMYPDLLKKLGSNLIIEPIMVQRLKKESVAMPDDLLKVGDFFLHEDRKLSEKLINSFLSKPLNMDMINAAVTWYKKPPFKIDKVMQKYDNNGVITNVEIINKAVNGVF